MDPPTQTLKRKQPPTFQHFPIQRAKKLKRKWVETVKIKSKWKAEKRKAGITGPVRPFGHNMQMEEGEERTDGKDDEQNGEVEVQAEDDGEDSASEEENKDNNEDDDIKTSPPNRPAQTHMRSQQSFRPSDSSIRPYQNQNSSQSHLNSTKFKGKHKEEPLPADLAGLKAPSLRDLKREAYSQKMLHNFKSDPLGKTRGRGHSRGYHRRGYAAEGEEGGSGRRRGRGQPNIQLRMNVMLEKIKRNVVSSS